jgi:hypothetical protein
MRPTTIEKILDSLAMPGALFVDWFFPSHGIGQIVALVLFSLTFYTLFFWFLMQIKYVIGHSRMDRPVM